MEPYLTNEFKNLEKRVLILSSIVSFRCVSALRGTSFRLKISIFFIHLFTFHGSLTGYKNNHMDAELVKT
jgi:hypothetical protein